MPVIRYPGTSHGGRLQAVEHRAQAVLVGAGGELTFRPDAEFLQQCDSSASRVRGSGSIRQRVPTLTVVVAEPRSPTPA